MLTFEPNRNIQKQNFLLNTKKLLFISEVAYLDYEIMTLPNLVNIFVPIKRIGYNFYLQSKNDAFSILKVRTGTIYKDNKPVTRCFLEFVRKSHEELLADDCDKFARYSTSAMLSKNKLSISFSKDESGLYKYDFSFNDNYLGFVSEFGEYETYNENAEGYMHFDFDSCGDLIKIEASLREDEYSTQYCNYRKLLKNNFPQYAGGWHSSDMGKIVGVAEDNANIFLIKYTNFANPNKYVFMKYTSRHILSATGDPFEFFNVDDTALFSDGNGKNRYSTNSLSKTFVTNDKNVGKNIKIYRGFSLSKVNETEKPSSFFSLLTMNNEIVFFHEYNPN